MTPAAPRFGIRGRTLAFRANPFVEPSDEAVISHADGIVVVENGQIVDCGEASTMLGRHAGLAVESYGSDLVMAGFVDAHAHYPQTGIIASYGEKLIEWLEKYTFPAEVAFSDPVLARATAETFLDECLRNGTTTASVYCTVHPASAEAFFEAALARGLRMAAGKVMMDRNAPPALLDTAQRGYDESKALIARWHGRARLSYVLTPRFAPTSTPDQLAAAGALWREHPGTLLQTHMSENLDEIAWVGRLFPRARDYLDVYDHFGLVGPGANIGHAIHLTPRERSRLAESGAGISHCPTSNTFIGSGLFDLQALGTGDRPIPIGLGTDVGGGSSFSMLATMKAAYEIAQLRGATLDPFRAYYLATLGSARVLGLETKVGNLAPGFDADIIVLDLASRPVIRQRMQRVENLSEALFVQMILGDDRAIRTVYVAGRKAHVRGAGAGA